MLSIGKPRGSSNVRDGLEFKKISAMSARSTTAIAGEIQTVILFQAVVNANESTVANV